MSVLQQKVSPVRPCLRDSAPSSQRIAQCDTSQKGVAGPPLWPHKRLDPSPTLKFSTLGLDVDHSGSHLSAATQGPPGPDTTYAFLWVRSLNSMKPTEAKPGAALRTVDDTTGALPWPKLKAREYILALSLLAVDPGHGPALPRFGLLSCTMRAPWIVLW